MADDLVKRIRELEAQLATVLQRETETHARHDARVDELAAEWRKDLRFIKELCEQIEQLNAKVADWSTRAESAEAKLAKAREALRFYADENGDGYDVEVTNYGLSLETGHIIADGGYLATATLKEIGNG